MHPVSLVYSRPIDAEDGREGKGGVLTLQSRSAKYLDTGSPRKGCRYKRMCSNNLRFSGTSRDLGTMLAA